MRRKEWWEIWKVLKGIATSHLIDEMRWDGLAGHGRYDGRSQFKSGKPYNSWRLRREKIV